MDTELIQKLRAVGRSEEDILVIGSVMDTLYTIGNIHPGIHSLYGRALLKVLDKSQGVKLPEALKQARREMDNERMAGWNLGGIER